LRAQTIPLVPALSLLASGLCLAPSAAEDAAVATPGRAFSSAYVQQSAQELAKKPFASAKEQVPERWASLGYDQYRDVRFRAERAIWHGERRNFELHLLPSGWLYKFPVAINIVDAGVIKPTQAASGCSANEFFGLPRQRADQPAKRL
jgi:periplasmic glucans biosynthesis protein